MESRDCKIINGFFLADVESVLGLLDLGPLLLLLPLFLLSWIRLQKLQRIFYFYIYW